MHNKTLQNESGHFLARLQLVAGKHNKSYTPLGGPKKQSGTAGKQEGATGGGSGYETLGAT